MNMLFHRLAPALALCLPLLAAAQTGRTDPADPKAPAPALRYTSAFADYKAAQDIKLGDWRAVNARVRDAAGQGSGHAGHGAPAAAASPASAPVATPKASAPPAFGHTHHPGSKQ